MEMVPNPRYLIQNNIIDQKEIETLYKDMGIYQCVTCAAKIYFAQYTHLIPPTQEIIDEKRQCKHKRYKLDLLQDPSVTLLYKLRLSQKLTQIDDSTPTKLYDGLVKSIHQTAEDSLGELDNGRNKESLYWWNYSIKESIEEKKTSG
ncbi:hypothetical protein HHI36_012255 [Cryptolaemus montrouzieri]|uniref:Uncharacterized protein n=1 Tax=Cryptolaemus montrouzieri TaxID=559131 RepID=A0ABD2NE58_9CUCU